MKFKRLKLANEITIREGSHKELAKKLGYSQVHITKIVCCKSDGSMEFWSKLQKLWAIPNEDLMSYTEKTQIQQEVQ